MTENKRSMILNLTTIISIIAICCLIIIAIAIWIFFGITLKDISALIALIPIIISIIFFALSKNSTLKSNIEIARANARIEQIEKDKAKIISDMQKEIKELKEDIQKDRRPVLGIENIELDVLNPNKVIYSDNIEFENKDLIIPIKIKLKNENKYSIDVNSIQINGITNNGSEIYIKEYNENFTIAPEHTIDLNFKYKIESIFNYKRLNGKSTAQLIPIDFRLICAFDKSISNYNIEITAYNFLDISFGEYRDHVNHILIKYKKYNRINI